MWRLRCTHSIFHVLQLGLPVDGPVVIRLVHAINWKGIYAKLLERQDQNGLVKKKLRWAQYGLD
ncbi:hypothetical protein EPI10_023196 [Gossypium australe]|uniref:Uncharacterized protein n=1 Tax=Gossypium australe TaxID=47621 RepID=A0A5B6VTZ5_9ROSI|nr:hypothetical protein EPI10_023196 [Gossypium australe]